MDSDIHRSIGANLRELRMRRGLTADELARAMRERGAPWTNQTAGMSERGERCLTIIDLSALARIGVTLDDLMAGVDLPRSSEVAGEAEHKVALRLSSLWRRRVEPADVMTLAQATWGRSFAAERESRLAERTTNGARSLQAHRGHVSRQMIRELSKER